MRELLTPRQHEVLLSLADGIPAKVIAARLGVAEATVRNHSRALFAALGTHSQLEAIAKARRVQLGIWRGHKKNIYRSQEAAESNAGGFRLFRRIQLDSICE